MSEPKPIPEDGAIITCHVTKRRIADHEYTLLLDGRGRRYLMIEELEDLIGSDKIARMDEALCKNYKMIAEATRQDIQNLAKEIEEKSSKEGK